MTFHPHDFLNRHRQGGGAQIIMIMRKVASEISRREHTLTKVWAECFSSVRDIGPTFDQRWVRGSFYRDVGTRTVLTAPRKIKHKERLADNEVACKNTHVSFSCENQSIHRFSDSTATTSTLHNYWFRHIPSPPPIASEFDTMIDVPSENPQIQGWSPASSCNYTMLINPLPTKLSNFSFHPLEVVSRYRDPQLQVGENTLIC